MLQRDCSRARQQRQTTLGPLALGLSEVSAANVSGMGRPFARFLCLGERVLRAATRERQTGNTVVRALAYKWIRILFRCWKDRTPYCESTHLETLERRRRFAPKVSPVKVQWKTSAGFRKIEAATS